MIGSIEQPQQIMLILMAGLAGVGKTTLAYNLGRELGYPVYDKDYMKDSFLKWGFSNKDAGWYAFDMWLDITKDTLIKQKISVILDSSALHPFIFAQAKEFAYLANAQLKIIHCHVENDIRLERLKMRETRPSQQNVIATAYDDDAQSFSHLPRELTYHLDTIVPPEQCVLKAMAYLRAETPQYIASGAT